MPLDSELSTPLVFTVILKVIIAVSQSLPFTSSPFHFLFNFFKSPLLLYRPTPSVPPLGKHLFLTYRYVSCNWKQFAQISQGVLWPSSSLPKALSLFLLLLLLFVIVAVAVAFVVVCFWQKWMKVFVPLPHSRSRFRSSSCSQITFSNSISQCALIEG